MGVYLGSGKASDPTKRAQSTAPHRPHTIIPDSRLCFAGGEWGGNFIATCLNWIPYGANESYCN